jgi:hypothetical protein
VIPNSNLLLGIGASVGCQRSGAERNKEREDGKQSHEVKTQYSHWLARGASS